VLLMRGSRMSIFLPLRLFRVSGICPGEKLLIQFRHCSFAEELVTRKYSCCWQSASGERSGVVSSAHLSSTKQDQNIRVMCSRSSRSGLSKGQESKNRQRVAALFT
jgi:hypothetical protein